MIQRRVAAGAAALLLAMSAAGTALAVIPGTLDQSHDCATTSCNDTTDATYPTWYSGNGTGNNDATAGVTLAQTFTAGVTGKLNAVSLYLAGIDGAPVPTSFQVGVTNVDGSGKPDLSSVVTSGIVATSGTTLSTSMTPAWVTVVFGTPPTVTAGHKYAIVLGVATLSASNAWMRWAIDSSASGAYTDYAGGEAMAASRPTSGSPWSWATMISILTDGGSGTADFGFRTYVTAAAAATPTPSIPSQPPTDTVAPKGAAGAGGATALLGLLAAVAAVSLILPARRPRRRRR
jgi:hypothetical protein